MMFRICFVTLLAFLSLNHCSYAQESRDITSVKSARPTSHHKVLYRARNPYSYIGFSSGINNPGGLLGFDLAVPVKKSIMLTTGVGFSSWGNKLHLDGKYFLMGYHLGWALMGGFAYSSGAYNFRARLRTLDHKRESVTINMNPVGSACLGASHFGRLGKRQNRVFVDLGYCVPLRAPQYNVTYNGPQLADQASRYIKLREPGGIMAGIGMLFGLFHYTSHKPAD